MDNITLLVRITTASILITCNSSFSMQDGTSTLSEDLTSALSSLYNAAAKEGKIDRNNYDKIISYFKTTDPALLAKSVTPHSEGKTIAQHLLIDVQLLDKKQLPEEKMLEIKGCYVNLFKALNEAIGRDRWNNYIIIYDSCYYKSCALSDFERLSTEDTHNSITEALAPFFTP